MVQDLAAVDVVQAAGGDRHVVHRPEDALEVRGAVLDEVVRGVEPLHLGGRDVERHHLQAALGEEVGGPAGVGPDVQQRLAGPKVHGGGELADRGALDVPVAVVDVRQLADPARGPSRRRA